MTSAGPTAFANASFIRQQGKGMFTHSTTRKDAQNYFMLHQKRNLAIKKGNIKEAKGHNLAIRDIEHKYKMPSKMRTARKNIMGTQKYYDNKTGKMTKLGGKRRTRKRLKKKSRKHRHKKRHTRRRRRTHPRRRKR